MILESEVTQVELGEQLKKELYYGFTCNPESFADIERLKTYKHILEEERSSVAWGGKPCLKEDELQSLYEKVKKITASCDVLDHPDLIINKDRFDRWVAKNPYCVPRQKWEKFAFAILCDIGLDVKIIEEVTKCDVELEYSVKSQECDTDIDVCLKEIQCAIDADFDIKFKNLVCDLSLDVVTQNITCDIMVAINAYQKFCDLGLTVKRVDEKQCKIELDILKCETTCDLSLEQYVCLKECNLSFDIMKVIYDDDCSLSCSDSVPLLHTKNGKYNLQSIKFLDDPNSDILKKYGITINRSQFSEDPALFIKKLNKEYGGY